MKKCASCTKDLPDAALHCVFCGAKQPPAPAVQQGLAKTAFGYSANDMIDQLRQQGGPRPATPAAPAFNAPPAPSFNAPPAPSFNAPPAPSFNAPPYSPPRPAAPPPSPYNPPQGYPAAPPPPSGFVPASAANAATMFVQGGSSGSPAAQNATIQAPPPSYGRPNPAAPAMAPTLVPPAPPQQQPPQAQMPPPRMAIPASQPPPYLASHTASRIGRPVEPWKDSLRLMMFFWGVALLAVFATPLRTAPSLAFHWNLILDGEGTARLPPLMFAAVGLLSVVVSGIPMQPAARGMIAAVLGLAGIAVPIALVGMPPWQAASAMIGTLVLVPGLLVRSEYRSAMVPRLLVTLGAVGILLPFVLPQGGAIPLVTLFKALIDLPGSAKIAPALALGEITIAVMALLAWLPAPVTGAATLWAWLLVLWALITHVTLLLLAGNLGDAITAAPNAALVSWIAGGISPTGIAIGSGYLAIVAYGLASVVGKQLE